MSDCVVCNASNLAITIWAQSACAVFLAVVLRQADSLSARSVAAEAARVAMVALRRRRRRRRRMPSMSKASQPKKTSKQSCLMAHTGILLPPVLPLLLRHLPQRQLPLRHLLPLHNFNSALICSPVLEFGCCVSQFATECFWIFSFPCDLLFRIKVGTV